MLYDVADHICTITLNRPQQRNAQSTELLHELDHAILAAGADPGFALATPEGKHRPMVQVALDRYQREQERAAPEETQQGAEPPQPQQGAEPPAPSKLKSWGPGPLAPAGPGQRPGLPTKGKHQCR